MIGQAYRVLVVDDSAFMRRYLKMILETDSRLVVVDVARNGVEAIEKLESLKPDVITLDINMPVMDGLTALSHIMIIRPTPVVMVSSLTQDGALATLEALELGAVDFIAKPSGTVSLDIELLADEINGKVRTAARAKLRRPALAKQRPAAPVLRRQTLPKFATVEGRFVAIGVSTGGPQTLLEILPQFPANFPAPVAIVQHIPANFTASLAKRLDSGCALPVQEAVNNRPLLPGNVYIAPGGTHLTVRRSVLGRGPVAHLSQEPKDRQFRPSVGVLFDSVAEEFGPAGIGVLLTGMGDDGADGMVRIKAAGGVTIAESEETAIVFGMPREAILRGGATFIVPNTKVADCIVDALRKETHQ